MKVLPKRIKKELTFVELQIILLQLSMEIGMILGIVVTVVYMDIIQRRVIKIRLWHYKLLSGLPKNQLVAQLRECVAIAKSIKENGTPNHILVNKIMDYDLEEFRKYCNMVIYEMVCERSYKVSEKTINKLEEYIDFNVDTSCINDTIFKNWHNVRYANQCYSNLEEKYDCKGLTEDEWSKFIDSFAEYVSKILEKIKSGE